MINRREVLLGISAATLGATASSASRLAEFLGQTEVAADHAADERLRKDLARREHRTNSEEGVPVFLGCMNLVTVDKAPPVKLTALNTAVAAEFRQTAAAWERIRPNSTEADVAAVIVVLADRDFLNGGTDHTS